MSSKRVVIAAAVVAAAIATGTAATGALTFGSTAGNQLAQDASADRSLRAFEATLQSSGASYAVQDAVAKAVLPIEFVVDGYRIPNYGIAMGVLDRGRIVDLTTQIGLRRAIIGTLTDMAEDHLLYDDAIRAHVPGPTHVEIRHAEDGESAAVAHDKHSPFPSLAAARQYYHSRAFVHGYVRSVLVMRERQRLTKTRGVVTPAQAAEERRLLVAWALRSFPGRVTISGVAGLTVEVLAMEVA